MAALLILIAQLLRRINDPQQIPSAITTMLTVVRDTDGRPLAGLYDVGGVRAAFAEGLGGIASNQFQLVMDLLRDQLQAGCCYM